MQKYTLSKDSLSEILHLYNVPFDRAQYDLVQPSEMLYDTNSSQVGITLPGGLLGELAIFLSAGEQYGFGVDGVKTWEVLSTLSSNERQLRTPFFDHIVSHPEEFFIIPHASFLSQIAQSFKALYTDSQYPNGAVLIMQGDDTISLPLQVEVEVSDIIVYPFVFHHIFVNEWHRKVCDALVEKRAVTLLDGQDTEYLYEVVSDTTDTFLFEDMRFSAPTLPIYSVTLSSDEMKVEDLT